MNSQLHTKERARGTGHSVALSRPQVAELNADCDCLPLPRPAIDRHIDKRWGAEPVGSLVKAKSNLFASTAVFVAETDWQAMQAQVKAIEDVITLPAYQQAIADRTPGYREPRTPGVFMGYDFHLTSAGPRLIEINTNAGGAMLANSALAAAHSLTSICGPAEANDPEQVHRDIVQMLVEEWRRAQGAMVDLDAHPSTIAIVDEKPTEQYLYADMLILAQLLSEHGIRCLIVDPSALTIRGRRLLANGEPIDLVCNRLTDFSFAAPANRVLKQAHDAQLAVVSPAPEHHASFADKRNLGLLTPAKLTEFGASPEQIDALAELPKTTAVTDASAEQLWADRKSLFFKPHSGFGSRAVYRGSKLTRKVWQQMLGIGYLAQPLVEPGRRAIPSELLELTDNTSPLKFDVRLYTYRSNAILTTARLYRGQTTNFRTAGGGFAPVLRLP